MNEFTLFMERELKGHIAQLQQELAAATARAEAAEAYHSEWQEAAQAYGDYRQKCSESGIPYFNFWDWGTKGQPTEAQP